MMPTMVEGWCEMKAEPVPYAFMDAAFEQTFVRAVSEEITRCAPATPFVQPEAGSMDRCRELLSEMMSHPFLSVISGLMKVKGLVPSLMAGGLIVVQPGNVLLPAGYEMASPKDRGLFKRVSAHLFLNEGLQETEGGLFCIGGVKTALQTIPAAFNRILVHVSHADILWGVERWHPKDGRLWKGLTVHYLSEEAPPGLEVGRAILMTE